MEKLPDKPTALADLLSISIPYASQILNGARPWPRALAIAAFRKTGEKVGPIANATDEDIEVLARYETPSRPQDAA